MQLLYISAPSSSSSSSLALKCIFRSSRLLIEGQDEDTGGRSWREKSHLSRRRPVALVSTPGEGSPCPQRIRGERTASRCGGSCSPPLSEGAAQSPHQPPPRWPSKGGEASQQRPRPGKDPLLRTGRGCSQVAGVSPPHQEWGLS